MSTTEMERECARVPRVTAKVEWSDKEPPEGFVAGSVAYVVTLRFKRRQLKVPFYCGPGVCGEPSAADVVSCLIMDTWAYLNSSDAEEFAGEMGYENAWEAIRVWGALEKQTPRVRRFFGDDFERFSDLEH